MIAAIAHPVAILMADLNRRGIRIKAHGDQLHYRPRKAMTPDLAAALKAHKPALLALLRMAPAATPANVLPHDSRASVVHPIDLLGRLRQTFGQVTVVSDEPARTFYRRKVKAALLPIYRADPDRGIALRDQWAERIAITTADGQTDADAERAAWEEVKMALDTSGEYGIIIPS